MSNTTEKARTFETANEIEITRKTIKFGNAVYQFKNVSGFSFGEIPKNPFPWEMVASGILIGGLLTVVLIGFLILLWVAYIIFAHFTQPTQYGLILALNSGELRYFVSRDKQFIIEIVDKMYDFMETDFDGVVHIDMSNKSISVAGNVSGSVLSAGHANDIVNE